jgi:hypothetical protein
MAGMKKDPEKPIETTGNTAAKRFISEQRKIKNLI